MKDMSVNGVAAAQQNWSREQQQAEAAPPAEGAGEDLSAALSQQEEEGRDLLEMIREQGQKGAGNTYRRQSPKIGRNNPCPCGSGKKYKKCCGKED